MKKLYFYILILLGISCQRSQDSLSDMDSRLLKPVQTYNSIFLGRPYQIELIDSILIVAENVSDTVLSFYNIIDSTLLCRRLTVGQGPNELLNPIVLQSENDAKQITVLQRQNGIFTVYALDSLLRGSNVPAKKVELPFSDRFVRTETGYICTGLYENGIARYMSIDGTENRDINIFPDCVAGISDRTVRYKFAQGSMAYHKGVLAFAPYFLGYVEFYSVERGACVSLGRSYFADSSFENKVRESKGNLQITDDDIMHCYGAASGGDNFFILYSGKKMAERNKIANSYIYEFDNAGQCLAKYEIEGYVEDFCVSGKAMYCIVQTQDNEPMVVKYLLP